MENKATLTAHRGYRSEYPENTMLAFREALKLDVDSIEMDVHMTSDYRIIVMHDNDVTRTTDGSGKICDMTSEEIGKLDAGIKFGEQFKGEKVPFLEEFLELMATRPDIKVLLELKDYPEELGDFAYASCEKTLELCRQYGVWGKDRLTVITFSTGICAWLRHRYTREDFPIHGFYPKSKMRGWEKDDPYKYYDEVCIFQSEPKTLDGRRVYPYADPVADKMVFDMFKLMGLKVCAYYKFDNDEAHYAKAVEYGAVGFTCDDPLTCGKILDKLGVRKLK